MTCFRPITRRTVAVLAGTVCLFAACDKAQTPEPVVGKFAAAALAGNRITICDIADLPTDAVIDRVQADLQGVDFAVVATLKAPFADGEAVLTLPEAIATDSLMPAIRADASDYAAKWPAQSDNPEAKVASIGDINAYHDGERVGRFYLTNRVQGQNLAGTTTAVYYLYADTPFTATGTSGSFRYNAAFEAGWNAYANTILTEGEGAGYTLITTDIPVDPPLVWHFGN